MHSVVIILVVIAALLAIASGVWVAIALLGALPARKADPAVNPTDCEPVEP